MSEKKYELIETLQTLVKAQETMDELGVGIVRFETSFLKEVLEELKDKVEIYSNSGELVCTIEGPEATIVIEQAVDMYMRSALIKFTEENSPQ